MRIALLVPLALLGCEKKDPLFCKMNPTDPACSGIDAALFDGREIDGPLEIDAPARLDFGTGAYAVLLTQPATGTINFDAAMANTTGGNPCLGSQFWVDSGQPPACFVVANNIVITGSGLAVTGNRPLVLVAADKITVSGLLDAASHVVGDDGPGVPFTCPLMGTAPGNASGGGGGGAGGSFMTRGGNGGGGDGGTNGGTSAVADTNPPMFLRAGCNGQTGGTGGTGGAGGRAGGAVYLVAGNTIDLAGGTINVSGSGGNLGTSRGGGGGGGTGGMLVLYAPSVLTDVGTRLVANGGGGSGGANGGTAGGDPIPATPAVSALGGGSGGSCTTNVGGTGAAGAGAGAGGPGPGNCGGGGGGGAHGYIRTNVPLGTGAFSPSPDLMP